MIYFIRIGVDGPIKVGFTSGDPAKRLHTLQAGCPYDLQLLAIAEGDLNDERGIHAKFAESRMRGEWFDPSPALLDHIGQFAAPAARRRRGGPPALDPSVSKSIYPPRSLWERVEKAALADRRKPAEMAVLLIEAALDAREATTPAPADA